MKQTFNKACILLTAATVAGIHAAQQAPQKLTIPYTTQLINKNKIVEQRALLRMTLSKEKKRKLDHDLINAVEKKDQFTLRQLLERGANPNRRIYHIELDCYVPLIEYANCHGYRGITQDLRNAGANSDSDDE